MRTSTDLETRFEEFDRLLAKYETMSKTKVADDIRVGVLVVRQLPEGALKQPVLLNMDRLDTYSKVRAELIGVLRAQQAANPGIGTAIHTRVAWQGQGQRQGCEGPSKDWSLRFVRADGSPQEGLLARTTERKGQRQTQPVKGWAAAATTAEQQPTIRCEGSKEHQMLGMWQARSYTSWRTESSTEW
eukprot:6195173-Amphidinium_carterae.1